MVYFPVEGGKAHLPSTHDRQLDYERMQRDFQSVGTSEADEIASVLGQIIEDEKGGKLDDICPQWKAVQPKITEYYAARFSR